MQEEHEREWEPGGILRKNLEGLPLEAETNRDEGPSRLLAVLKPHVEETLGSLDRLERRYGRSISRKDRGGRPAQKDAPSGTRATHVPRPTRRTVFRRRAEESVCTHVSRASGDGHRVYWGAYRGATAAGALVVVRPRAEAADSTSTEP